MADKIIDIGNRKQLLLDEQLCESSEGVRLTMNPARSTGEILIGVDNPYERAIPDTRIGSYSSVLKEDGKVRMWWYYNVGSPEQMQYRRVCYGESEDGIHFVKPKLGLVEMGGTKANNAVIGDPIQGACVFIDPVAPPERRYKTQAKWGPFPGTDTTLYFYASPDGIHWEKTHAIQVGACDTQNVVFWDEAYGKYVMYTREWVRFGDPDARGKVVDPRNHRGVRRLESTDLVTWNNESMVWEADEVDLATHTTSTGMPPVDYYGACVYKYPEAGDFYIFLAQPFWHWKDRPEEEKWGYSPDPKNLDKRAVRLAPSTMDVRLGYSRDGKVFERAVDRGPFLGTGPEGRFDSRMVWAMPNPIEMGDEIWIYYVGTNRDHDRFIDPAAPGLLSGIGRATMRLDGFVSADADYTGGWLVTRPLTFEGEGLELNMDASAGGFVRVEMLDAEEKPVEGFTMDESETLLGNSVRMPAGWSSENDLGTLTGTPVRLKFQMRDAKLYSFWFK